MDHPFWPAAVSGIAACQSGDSSAGQQLSGVWRMLGADDHALRCIVAHYLADLQGDDVQAELEWDRRALAAHAHIRDEELAPLGISSAAFLPSLHLNLGDAWLRAGDAERARSHLEQARAAESALGPDPYGDLVRRGLAGLATRVEDALSAD